MFKTAEPVYKLQMKWKRIHTSTLLPLSLSIHPLVSIEYQKWTKKTGVRVLILS